MTLNLQVVCVESECLEQAWETPAQDRLWRTEHWRTELWRAEHERAEQFATPIRQRQFDTRQFDTRQLDAGRPELRRLDPAEQTVRVIGELLPFVLAKYSIQP